MKKFLYALVIIVVILPVVLCSCANPGPMITRQFEYTDFVNVQVGSAFEADITPADTYSISVTAPQNWFDSINIDKTGNTLEVGMEWGWNFWRNLGSNRPRVRITMPQLNNLELSGATKSNVTGFKSSGDFKLSLSGASTLDLSIEAYDTSLTVSGASTVKGQLYVHDIRLNLSGASTAVLSGTGNNLNLQVSGASHASLDGLEVKDARAEVSGASRASVSPTGTLDIHLSGASTLEYTGSPVIGTLDVTGASSVKKK